MDRVDPAVAAAGVDLLDPEHHALAPVGVEAPGVAVSGLAGPRLPGPLQGFPPAGAEHLIQIGTHADVRLLRHQLQGAVPGGVNRQGEMTSWWTSAPRARSRSTVPSSEPVSRTTTRSASPMASIQRSANFSSFLLMA